MCGLRHGLGFTHTHAGSETESASKPGAEIGQDVTEGVGGNHHVELLRLHRQLQGKTVDQHVLHLHAGVILDRLVTLLGKHAAHQFESRRLVHGGHHFTRPRGGNFTSDAGNTVRPLAGDHAHADRNLVVRPELAGTSHHRAGARQTLGGFAHKHHIHVFVHRRNVGVRAHWLDAGKQLEGFAKRRHHPGRIFLRIGAVPDRPHQPAVQTAQTLLGARRYRMTKLFMRLAADRQRMPFDLQPGFRRRRLHHLDRFGYHFESDIVAQQNTYFQHDPCSPLMFSSTSGGAPLSCAGSNLRPDASRSPHRARSCRHAPESRHHVHRSPQD